MQYILLGLEIGHEGLTGVEFITIADSEPDLERFEVSQFEEVICVALPENSDICAAFIMRMQVYRETVLRRRLNRE